MSERWIGARGRDHSQDYSWDSALDLSWLREFFEEIARARHQSPDSDISDDTISTCRALSPLLHRYVSALAKYRKHDTAASDAIEDCIRAIEDRAIDLADEYPGCAPSIIKEIARRRWSRAYEPSPLLNAMLQLTNRANGETIELVKGAEANVSTIQAVCASLA